MDVDARLEPSGPTLAWRLQLGGTSLNVTLILPVVVHVHGH